jgi:hypothetical protein
MDAMNGLGKAMRTMHTLSLSRLMVAFLLAGSACSQRTQEPNLGTCLPDPVVDCSANGLPAESIYLAGYSCTGTARPDEKSTYVDGVPQGLVCADQGAVGADGKNGYCCTNFTTPCSYNPGAICDAGTYGFQCQGADRPEALNPTISCNQGVREDLLINYCCSGAQRAANCVQSDAIGCSTGTMGWTCLTGSQPTAQDMGASKSRADTFYQLCPVPTPAGNPKYNNFCCYVPALVPAGGSCQQSMNASTCTPGRFGIACYGPDRPDDNFARLHCPDPGVPGINEQGYPATIYCCDYANCQLDKSVPNCASDRVGYACQGLETPDKFFSRLRCPDPGVPRVDDAGAPTTLYCCDRVTN